MTAIAHSVPYWRLAGLYFFYFAYLGAFAPFWSLYLESLGHGAGAIAILMAIPQAIRIFSPHLWGAVADRIGARMAVVQATGLLGTACYFGVFAGDGFVWLFCVTAAWTFFWSAALPLLEPTTLNHLAARTAGYGRIRLWGSIGFILAVVGVGQALEAGRMQWLLGIVGALLAISLGLSALVPDASAPARAQSVGSVWSVARRPEVLALLGACLLMAFAHGPYYTFFSIHLAEHGYGKASIGWLWALGVIAEVVVFYFLASLMKLVHLRTLLIASFAAAVVRFVLIGWWADSLAVMIGAQVLHAASFGSFHAAALSIVHRFFRGEHQARGQAIYSGFSFGLGGTLGTLASGYGWSAVGPAGTYTAAAVAAAIGGVWLYLRLRVPAEESVPSTRG